MISLAALTDAQVRTAVRALRPLLEEADQANVGRQREAWTTFVNEVMRAIDAATGTP